MASNPTVTAPAAPRENPSQGNSKPPAAQKTAPPVTGKTVKGGDFLIGYTAPEDLFITEEWDEEARMIAEMVKDFMVEEIQKPMLASGKELTVTNEEDRQKVLGLLKKAGEMGLCGVGIQEEYGGTNLDFKTSTLFGATAAWGFSFATTLGAQTSIGSLPIVYYGNDQQKAKYLPKIATGEWIAAYALTEPNAGSDANSGRTTAKLNEAGTHYIVEGQKIWITNGGFADIFIVFAKIDDDENLSAFIVERTFDGFSVGPEEHKMGIKGSSTVQIFFEAMPVPVENLLGERNEGFKIALNILNNGRLKAASGTCLGAQLALTRAVEYAVERRQFDTPIAEFGAIQYKIGEIATQAFAYDAVCYRIAHDQDRKVAEFEAAGHTQAEAKLKAMMEFAVEAAIIKVKGTELACYATDEGIQIHGGMGYAVETGMEMAYRDARITRIYEGTNEINRLLAVAELSKRGIVTKEIDLVGAGKKIPGYYIKQLLPFRAKNGRKAEERTVQSIKNIFLLVSGAAGKKLGKKLVDEQEMVINFSDILAEALVCDTLLLKIKKLEAKKDGDKSKLPLQQAMLQLYLYEARARVQRSAKDAIDSFAVGFQKKMLHRMVSRLLGPYELNPKELRRKVARAVIDNKGYCF